MLTFETAYFDKKNSGDIVFRFNNDADLACVGLLDNLKTFILRIFSSLSLIGVLFYNSWQLALIAIVVLGCAFLPITSIQKRIKSVIDKSISVTAAVISPYNGSFAGNKTITAYNTKRIQETKYRYWFGNWLWKSFNFNKSNHKWSFCIIYNCSNNALYPYKES